MENALTDLANQINDAQQTFHELHFHAHTDGDGGFDDVHNEIGAYYDRMQVDYDDAVELAYQCGEDVVLRSPEAKFGGTGYKQAFEQVWRTIHAVLEQARVAYDHYSGGGINDLAVQNWLGGFIEYWSKEADYKTARRIGGDMDDAEMGKAIIKAITDGDPVGKVRKANGALYRKTPDGWVKLPSRRNSQQYAVPAEELISGLSNSEVKKALEAVKLLIRKARRYNEGEISHRADGDWKKQGGGWVKVPASERQNQMSENTAGGDGRTMQQNWDRQNPNSPMQFGSPPNPVEEKLNNRSLASMATHGNEVAVNDAKDSINAYLKKKGVSGAVTAIQNAFEATGNGDLFDMDMPIDQLAETMVRAGIKLERLDEGGQDFGGFSADTLPQGGEFPEMTAQDMYDDIEGGDELTEDAYAEQTTEAEEMGMEHPTAGHSGEGLDRWQEEAIMDEWDEDDDDDMSAFEPQDGGGGTDIEYSIHPTEQNQTKHFSSEGEADEWQDKNDANVPYINRLNKSTGIQPSVPVPHHTVANGVGKDHATGYASGGGQEGFGSEKPFQSDVVKDWGRTSARP